MTTRGKFWLWFAAVALLFALAALPACQSSGAVTVTVILERAF